MINADGVPAGKFKGIKRSGTTIITKGARVGTGQS